MSVMVFSIFTFVTQSNAENSIINYDEPVQQVCKFSLSSTTGTIAKEISSGICSTFKFKVLLSCPQEAEVSATVSVIIDNEVVANKVVSIEKGKKESTECEIEVGGDYIGKKYKLKVE